MIKIAITSLIILIGLKSYGQNKKSQYLGLNLLQLPTSTINFNYSIECKPFMTTIADIGYTLGYNTKYDFIGYYLAMHSDTENGYTIEKQSGGYLKVGGFFNLRKNFEKQNYFHLGLFLTNSIVYEKGLYLSLNDSRPYSDAENVEHTVFLFGYSISFGYEFKIAKRLRANIDFQLSFPTDKFYNLYGGSTFVPGIGYNDSAAKWWFPMIILNVKYRL